MYSTVVVVAAGFSVHDTDVCVYDVHYTLHTLFQIFNFCVDDILSIN